jgi:hypothetical protein
MSAVLARLRDYRAFGIPHIRVIDPATRELFQYAGDSLTEVRQFELPEYGVTIALAAILPD